MNRLLVAASALSVLAVASTASAADLGARAPAYSKAPAYVEQVSEWTGFYVGGSVGARTSDVTWTSVNFTNPDGSSDGLVDSPNSANLGNTSARLGVYLGYNWQIAPRWVIGLEGDAAWANNDVTHAGFPEPSSDTVDDSARVKLGWDGSIRGRIGFLATPNVLLYGTGGVAWQQVDATGSCLGTPSNNSVCSGVFSTTTSVTKTGWTLGAGIEAMITPHVALRGEYRFSDFGHVSNQIAVTTGDGLNSDIRVRTNIATVGVAYKF